MRTVDLLWRGRLSRKKRAIVVEDFRKFYPGAKDVGASLRLKAKNQDMKYIWLFMFIKVFKDIE